MVLEKTLRQHLVEQTRGTATDRDSAREWGPEFAELCKKISFPSGDNLLLTRLDGWKIERKTIDDFELIPPETVDIGKIEGVVVDYFAQQGYSRLIERSSVNVVLERKDERVYVILTNAHDKILVKAYAETIERVTGYEQLRAYLAGLDDHIKAAAVMAFDLGRETLGKSHVPVPYPKLFTDIFSSVMGLYREGYELNDEVCVISEEGFPEISDFAQRAFKVAKGAVKHLRDSPLPQVAIGCEKILGAYVLGAGGDVSGFSRKNDIERRGADYSIN